MGYPSTTRFQIFTLWLAVAALIAHAAGFILLAHFLPPTPPSSNAAQVGAFYRGNSTGIILMSILVTCVGPLIIPFFAVISVQLKRIEGQYSPLAYTQLISGAIGASMFALSAMLWAIAAFRPERPVEEIQLFNDAGWIFFLMPGPFAVAQLGAISVGILDDRRTDPIYPRWLGHQNLWTAVLVMPTACVALSTKGLFAWNGFLAFWLPAALFHAWFLTMMICTYNAIRKPAGSISTPLC